MVDVVFWVWVCGWAGITAAAAVIGGNQYRGGRPTWLLSLMLGWSWPFPALLVTVVASFALLGRLSDRYRNRKDSD